MENKPDRKHAESVGYWRRNAIMALKCSVCPDSWAVDPDDLAQIRADKAELATLLKREAAVRSRRARMLAKRHP